MLLVESTAVLAATVQTMTHVFSRLIAQQYRRDPVRECSVTYRLARQAKPPTTTQYGGCSRKAGGQGFEPRLADPESAVLPLDDPPVALSCYRMPERDAMVSER